MSQYHAMYHTTEHPPRSLTTVLVNKDIGWKSDEQRDALLTIMSWTEHIVAVLLTGAGKSLLFMLLCTLPNAGVTVLVVPLIPLYGDMLRRLLELKINYLE
ncbi:hypothetical protein LTR03_016539 [Friedmanniomyces endolithicus]|nr:hypothetical protein LTR03_016539 [Friedmanniomyces endolithicus]